jgi:hypothetical protein
VYAHALFKSPKFFGTLQVLLSCEIRMLLSPRFVHRFLLGLLALEFRYLFDSLALVFFAFFFVFNAPLLETLPFLIRL